ncbi:Uncharacterized protein CLAVI_000108 [Candidatus Clavichlamydia salmonicola]|uniref:metallophosphoesterase family protein n=1 Tax=Candidatus Clavichlamydia salmonicola TaxID=469812 RepID=UPI001890C1F6|nr:metallophosphoesterase [Candidatus Clavichlamydia salmonicola]MBF5050502.1 Uncharacterized protein [Candidatus Clavichlamydia salmonicola]
MTFPEKICISHLSDIHFAFLRSHPSSWLNKRLKGLLRILSGSVNFKTQRIHQLAPLLKQKGVNHAFITGDLTLTATPYEFKQALSFIKTFQKQKINVDILPGNHDYYTTDSFQKNLFYHTFPNIDLQRNKVYIKQLTHNWFWIGLDCTYCNKWNTAHGLYSFSIDQQLRSILSSLPNSAKVIIGNHFPVLPGKKASHDLLGFDLLQKTLKEFSTIKLYLHGHNHNGSIIDKRKESFPIIIDAGSATLISKSSFFIIHLSINEMKIEQFTINNLDKLDTPLSLSAIPITTFST